MLADRQLLLMRGTGDRTVDGREAAPAFLVPGPDFGGLVGGGRYGCVGHGFPCDVLCSRHGSKARAPGASPAGAIKEKSGRRRGGTRGVGGRGDEAAPARRSELSEGGWALRPTIG